MELLRFGSKCGTNTNAIPLGIGMATKNFLNASRAQRSIGIAEKLPIHLVESAMSQMVRRSIGPGPEIATMTHGRRIQNPNL